MACQIGLFRVDSGSWVQPNPIGLVRGPRTRTPGGPRPIGLALGPWTRTPGSAANRALPWTRAPGSKRKPIGLALGLSDSRVRKANRARRSSALKSVSGLDSGSVCCLDPQTGYPATCSPKRSARTSTSSTPKSFSRGRSRLQATRMDIHIHGSFEASQC
jgi:hypothetical protein